MRKTILLSLMFVALGCIAVHAQRATLRIDAQKKYQRITGFGGFVCSPQFQYNHMSTADIKKVWGPTSTVGCNIMRLYIPVGRNSWSQSLQTAKTAKQLGLIVFASPWGQPAEWKTNNSINAKNEGEDAGSLKKENWADYAQYLEDYVQYLRDNGVELDAISIQNEPDWPCSYAGCIWSASEIAEFVKTYGKNISCKVIAPETLAVRDDYVNALNNTQTLEGFDIYGGHQYGGIQSAYKNLGKKGKEIWMTEYLINWNEAENNTRNFDFSKDFFDFFRAINVCMLGDFNAWIHYAAKRYYGMLGDGQRGTTTSTVTKRGYIMAHFAKSVTGMTRVEGTFSDDAETALEGSVYLSQTGDTVVAVIANPSDNERTLLMDLPFYTKSGVTYTTSKTKNYYKKALSYDAETCRPEVQVAAQSVFTAMFVRSRDRQVSNMKGSIARFDMIENQTTTKSTFGTTYKLSNKTKTFDHSNPLFSSKTNAASGYVKLSNRFDKLVMHVNSISSTMNLSSAKTTLIYVNKKGEVASHDYGDLDLNRGSNFNLVFDLSPATLADGCIGIISMTNNNWSSTLTLKFGDVYLSNGGNYSATLSGAYVEDDSNVYDYTTDPSCTSIDMSAVTELPSSLPWLNNNKVVFAAAETPFNEGQTNVVKGTSCSLLSLSDAGGDFRPKTSFTAEKAEISLNVEGMKLVALPFAAVVPENVKAYKVNNNYELLPTENIEANQPVVIVANGEVVIEGSGSVNAVTAEQSDMMIGTSVEVPLYAGDYVLGNVDGKWGFVKLTAASKLVPFGVYAQLNSASDFVAFDLSATGINNVTSDLRSHDNRAYNLMGQRVSLTNKGLVIVNGRKQFHRK